MSATVPVNLAVEDILSESVLRKMLHEVRCDFDIGRCYRRSGSGYLKKNIRGFNHASKGMPFLVLTDLDRGECAPKLIAEWLAVPKHPNLIFRVAVREVESWLLADRHAFAKFLGIKVGLVPRNVDEVQDAKRFLIDLSRRSPSRNLREAIPPPPGTTGRQGPDYNGRLIAFVEES